MHEEVTFDRSHVTSVDWASYPILRFPDAPAFACARPVHRRASRAALTNDRPCTEFNEWLTIL